MYDIMIFMNFMLNCELVVFSIILKKSLIILVFAIYKDNCVE